MLISSSWISPLGEGGRQGRKPQANSGSQSTHRGLVLFHPEHPKYKEGVAPTAAPVTSRFFKTERRQILPGSQQTTTKNHSPQHPSHQRPICSLALRCQVTFKVPGRREQQDGGGRGLLEVHTSQSHAAQPPATVTTPKTRLPHGHLTPCLASTQPHHHPTHNHPPPQRAQ